MRKTIGLWACALAVVVTSACDASEAFNCSDICDAYDDCVIVDVDVTDCFDRCEDFADFSEANEEQVSACQNCYNDMECSAACNDQCAGVVPAL